jgi:hypothetical protein
MGRREPASYEGLLLPGAGVERLEAPALSAMVVCRAVSKHIWQISGAVCPERGEGT